MRATILDRITAAHNGQERHALFTEQPATGLNAKRLGLVVFRAAVAPS
jgi:hypothetical protein